MQLRARSGINYSSLIAKMQQTFAKPSPARKSETGLICLFLALITLALYWPVTHFEFNNYDDVPYVTENPNIQNGLTIRAIKWAFVTGYFGTWHPLTWLSHLLDVEIFGLHAGGHHFTSVLFHIANTLLLFLLLQRWTMAVWRAAFVAALFAWHPVHVESVAWVAERKDVLSTCFWLLALFAYGRYVGEPGKIEEIKFQKSRDRRSYYMLSLAFFALGLMAKPMLVSLPLILLLLDYWPLGRIQLPLSTGKIAALLREKIPFFLLAALSCVITFLAQKNAGAVETFDHYSFADRAANALVSYVSYVGKLFWPAKLAVLYPYVHNLPLVEVLGAAILLLAICALVVRLAKSRPWLLVGWLWFVITLVPVIGLVQVGEQAMADRYTYIPSIGIFLMIIWEVPRFLNAGTEGTMMLPSAAIILVVCLLTAAQQIRYWQNSITLWTHAIEVTKNNATAECNLGSALNTQGRAAEGIMHERTALKIKSDYAVAENNLACALGGQGKLDEAEFYLVAAIKSDPHYDRSYFNLGLTYMKTGRMDDAVAQFRSFIKLNSQYAPAYASLGHILAQQGHVEEAIEQYHKALAISPNYSYARDGLAEALQTKK